MVMLNNLMKERKCHMGLTVIYPKEVLNIISNLSNSNAFGLDDIDTYSIKLAKESIAPALTHVINLSIMTKTFPDIWKRSKIVPIYKKDDPLSPENYRPVSIIPVLSKILERAKSKQMVKYLADNGLIHPCHHAYRANHNTATALLQMYDSWINALESGKLAGICLLDMSAAFDVVDHRLLLQKVSAYGFQEDVVAWLESYLNNRAQAVSINGDISELINIQSGVPQGSILGPLLYTLYTNELPKVILQNNPNNKSCF